MDSPGAFQQRYRTSVEATFVVSLRIAKAKEATHNRFTANTAMRERH